MNRGQILPHRVTPMSNVYSHEWSLWRRAAKSWPRMIFFFSKQPEQSSIWQRRLLTQQLACCQLLGGNSPARLKCSSSTFVLQLLLKTCQINSLKFFWGGYSCCDCPYDRGSPSCNHRCSPGTSSKPFPGKGVSQGTSKGCLPLVPISPEACAGIHL